MIDLREIDGEISQLERAEISKSNVTVLAALYTIRNQLSGQQSEQKPKEKTEQAGKYSMRSVPLDGYGDSDFLVSVSGKDPAAAWRVMDDLMDTLKVVNQKVYNSVMEKIKRV